MKQIVIVIGCASMLWYCQQLPQELPPNQEGTCFAGAEKMFGIPFAEEYQYQDVMIHDISFSDDEKRIAVVTSYGFAIWEIETRKEIFAKILKCNLCPIGGRKIKFYGNSAFFVTTDSNIEKRDLQTKELVRTYKGEKNQFIHAFSLLLDDQRIVGASENSLFVWDIQTEQLIKKIDIRGAGVGAYSHLDVSPNQQWIALSATGTYIWNAKNYDFEKHVFFSGDIKFSPDNSLISSSQGVWRITDWSLHKKITGYALAWMGNMTLLTLDGDGLPYINVWDVRTGEKIYFFRTGVRYPERIAISLTRKYLAIAGTNSSHVLVRTCQE